MAESPLRMLVPLDGTSEAESVLPALLPLFRTQKVRLMLLAVAPLEESVPSLELYLRRLRTSLLVDEVASESRVEWGDPATEILRAGQAARFDLIAMATRGRKGLRRDLVGSVAETVLRQSEIPVLAFRPGAKIGDWNRMVVGLDGSAAAEGVLGDASAMARTMGATLHAVHAKSPKTRLTIHPEDAFPIPEEDPQPYMDRIVSALAEKGILAIPDIRVGDPAEEILAASRETGAGLICLTTHGRTGLARDLLGSVAESVLRNAPCPVLLRRAVVSEAAQKQLHAKK
jgi:nucleotide-binding universal stress UspA family protein